MDLEGKAVKLTGRFDIGGRTLIEARVRARGGMIVKGKKCDYLFAGNKPTASTVDSARANNIEVLDHDSVIEAIGEPLYNYVKRFEKMLDDKASYHEFYAIVYRHIAAPATAEAIAAAEEEIDMELDPALKAFYQQANGMTVGYRSVIEGEKPLEKFSGSYDGPYSEMLFMDSAPNAPELWKCPNGEYPRGVGTLNIPSIEALFASSWGDEYGMEDDKIRFGKTSMKGTIKGSDIFLLDATYGYQPIYLGIDRKKKQMFVTVGHDHGACLSDFDAIDIETYFEQLTSERLLCLSSRTFRKYYTETWWKE